MLESSVTRRSKRSMRDPRAATCARGAGLTDLELTDRRGAWAIRTPARHKAQRCRAARLGALPDRLLVRGQLGRDSVVRLFERREGRARVLQLPLEVGVLLHQLAHLRQ